MTTAETSRHAGTAAWTLCALSVAVAAGRLALAVADPASSDATSAPQVPGGGVPVAAFEMVALTVIALVGAVVASRQPRNPIGWIFGVIALFLGLLILFSHVYWTVALGQAEPSARATVIAWVATWIWIPPMLLAMTLLPLYFPTGRPPTPRWRWVEWLVAVAGPSLFVGTAFVPGEFEDYAVDNPFAPGGLLGDVLSTIGWVGFASMLAAGLGAAASLVVRFRRSVDVERQQIKWVVSAVVLFVVIFVTPTENIAGDDFGFASLLLGLMIIAIAVAVSILRYRLYDIDVVISRTLLVAGLAGFISVSYVAIVVGIGSLVGRGDEPNLVLSVAATAFVAVAFQPMRRRLQRLANRLVFGRRATPYDVLSGFATRVGAAEASPETLVGLAELMADGTGAQPARVWLRVGPQLRSAATWPVEQATTGPSPTIDAGTVPALPDADLAVPVREQDELLGVLTISKPRGERVTEVDVDLVERLAAASGVLLRNLKLDAELAERLEEIETSRRRLVTAQDEARRRIEVELGGGTRAHLRELSDQLSLLAQEVDTERTPKSAMLLSQLVTATTSALDTLASLAAGVYPPRLAADGLGAALSEQAGRAAVRIEVQATGVGRYPPDVEAAVYFAVLESLQNVSKYADADAVRVRLSQEGGRLLFEVTDDGAGFDSDTATLGTGLQGIIDRLDTVDGSVTITSHPDAGTTVAGSIPVVESADHGERTLHLAGAAS